MIRTKRLGMDMIQKYVIKGINLALIILMFSTIFISLADISIGIPQGPTIISNKTDNYTPIPDTQITTAGGSFTTLILNATTQTLRWKAYVGNVSGKLALDDANGKSIFDWRVASVTGEVYTTRNSTIDWSSIQCANSTTINNEDLSMNMSLSSPDTINKTFNVSIHKSFYVGTILMQNSTCRSIATYVNDTAQASLESASFQEMLLQDGYNRMVYATLINQNTTGYNNQKYDFQMIVAENEWQTTPTTYYLYVELV